MAFVLTDFKTGDSTGNGPAIHTYTTIDLSTVVDAAGYFNDVSGIVAVGDLIYVYGDTDGTPFYTFFPVLSNASGVVDVSDGTALAATDTR